MICTLFTGQTSKEGTYYFSCVLLLIADTRVVILHKKVPFASFSSQVPLQLK